ncbi:MAG: galactosyldiacylglycerol synthase [Armatimonadota bacterium]|nr:galactosyldiacylglycerol synthase [Armatimonadota bacterium]
MVMLYRREDDTPVGSITEQDLQFLIDCLVEEDRDDTDYYINGDTLDFLREKGASPRLVSVLQTSLEGREDTELYYRPEDAGGVKPNL